MISLIERSAVAGPLIPIEPVDPAHLADVRARLSVAQQGWLKATGFDGAAGSATLLANPDGELERVLVGMDARDPMASLGGLPFRLPPGSYALADEGIAIDRFAASLGWALGGYVFDRYRKSPRPPAQLAVPDTLFGALAPLAEATALVRDLVNTPAEDMGPAQLADTVKSLAKEYDGKYRDWVGDELLGENFPAIHAVGRASHREPRLLELTWGDASHPRLAIVGKGVCFDSGGLDIKPGDGMRWMKKDMGGSAHAIALAQLVMRTKLPVRLTLLVAAVDNAIAGNAMRPGDVIRTRAGLTVEVDNTDAEGRLVLCDAITYASEQEPDLVIDFATLTGAARVALGPDIPALFTNRDELAQDVMAAGRDVCDPLWQLPLWKPYGRMLDSYVADFANSGSSRHAGAITAAIYLDRFVPAKTAWMHLDTYSWNDADRPGKPRGGEAQGLRAFFAFLQKRYIR
jgi:leucyl aminopeptidase